MLVPVFSIELLFLRWQIRTNTFKHFRRHANRFAQRGVRVNGFADIGWVAAHFDGECDFADQVACVRADDAAADHAMRF